MTAKAAQERLCALTSKVGDHFKNQFASDCFCGKVECFGLRRTDEEIIAFIEKAVESAIKKMIYGS